MSEKQGDLDWLHVPLGDNASGFTSVRRWRSLIESKHPVAKFFKVSMAGVVATLIAMAALNAG